MRPSPTQGDDSSLGLGVGRYNWEFLTLHGGGFTIVEALEGALNQSMAWLWAVEEERIPDISDIPESVRPNIPEWNLRLLEKRWEKRRGEREELLGSL